MRVIASVATLAIVFAIAPAAGPARASRAVHRRCPRPAAGQCDRRVSTGGRPAAAGRHRRHAADLRGPTRRHAALAGNAECRARQERPLLAAAGRGAGRRDPARGVYVRGRAVAGAALCRRSAKWRGRARGSPACRTRCNRRMPIPSAGTRRRPTNWRRPATADGHPANATASTAADGAVEQRAAQRDHRRRPAGHHECARQVCQRRRCGQLGGVRIGRPGRDQHHRARRRAARPLHQYGRRLTGLAVQNLGNTATSYSGMLFYDQNGALGQFQGFNNVTHEYRINNIASSPRSINFMTGSTVALPRRSQRQHRHRHDRAMP